MRLIDINPLVAEGWILARTVPTLYGKTTQTMSLANVERAPDLRPVGRWVKNDEYAWACTCCGGHAGLNGCEDYDLTDYCPHCGARMEADHETD